MKICMFVRNPVTKDPRVRREAAALVAAGHQVVIIGIQRKAEAPTDTLDGAQVIRLPGLNQRVAHNCWRGQNG